MGVTVNSAFALGLASRIIKSLLLGLSSHCERAIIGLGVNDTCNNTNGAERLTAFFDRKYNVGYSLSYVKFVTNTLHGAVALAHVYKAKIVNV